MASPAAWGTAEFFGEHLAGGLEVTGAGQSIQRMSEPADLGNPSHG
jgi:hypothetical protein